jgi:hypothetical protein
VIHPANDDRPALVHLSDPVGVGDGDVGQELLAELPVAVEHLDAVYLHPTLAQREHEDGEPPVLGHVPVRPGQAQAPVGPPRARGPDLRAVQDPLVAVAHGAGEHPRDVRATAGLGQQLHPELLPSKDRGDVAPLLLLGAELEDDFGAGRQGRHLEAHRELVAFECLVQRPLVRRCEPSSAVCTRDADPAEPGFEESPLQLALMGDVGELLLLRQLVA